MPSTLASAPTPAPPSPPRARPLRCRNCGASHAAAPVAICGQCLGPLDPVYDPARLLPDRATIAARPPSLWRYREWLPFEGDIVHSLDTGFTPLVETPRLARRLGVARAWVKNDTVSHPSLSFKDRVVAAALNAAAAFGLETVGCASTGNLANAVAAHAARAGLEAWIFVPHELETGKVVAPIVRVVERGDDRIVPEIPRTIALSIAIGNPADGVYAARAIRATGGWAQAVTDAELVAGIRVLAEDAGVFAETAGGVTIAAALALARGGRPPPPAEGVPCIPGHGLETIEAGRRGAPPGSHDPP